MSAFFIGCRDVLPDGAYDIVIKVHTRTPKARSVNIARYFRRYQLENLLSSPGYVANVLGLFQREPGLGVVFPPMIHIGYAIPGRGWSQYRERAHRAVREARNPRSARWCVAARTARRDVDRTHRRAAPARRGRWKYRDYPASPQSQGRPTSPECRSDC